MTAVKKETVHAITLENGHLICFSGICPKFCILCNSTDQLAEACKVENNHAREVLAGKKLKLSHFQKAIKFLQNPIALRGVIEAVIWDS